MEHEQETMTADEKFKADLICLKELFAAGENPVVKVICDVILYSGELINVPGVFSRIIRIRPKIQKEISPVNLAEMIKMTGNLRLIRLENIPKLCPVCGCYHPVDDPSICQPCVTKHTRACEFCGELVSFSDDPSIEMAFSRGKFIRTARGESIACPSCYARNKVVCSSCGSEFHRGISRSGYNSVQESLDGAPYRDYCPACVNAGVLKHCPECGYNFPASQFHGDHCLACHIRSLTHKKRARVAGHGSKPAPVFISTSPLFTPLGVEIEVDDGNESDQLMEFFGTLTDILHLEHDGSLTQGIEIITNPCDLNFHEKHINYQEMFQRLEAEGYTGHDNKTAGIHVHIGKTAFGLSPATQKRSLARLVYLFEKFRPQLKQFSRRKEYGWTKFLETDLTGMNISELFEIHRRRNRDDRYMAVNLQNTNTTEIRLFKSTLNLKTFYAILELCDYLVKFINSHKKDEFYYSMGWSDFTAGIKYRDHPYLSTYISEKLRG